MSSIEASEFVSLAAELPFGKTLPDARYIHTCGLSVLPEEYSEIIETAAKVAGAPPGAFNVVKFDRSSPRVSLLSYPSFFDEGFPALVESWTIDLEQSSSTFRSYQPDRNPPILHRKETLLPPDHPLQGVFQTLTEKVERAGLLENARDIGRKVAWQARLNRVGIAVRGNELIDVDEAQSHSEEEILRHKTALVRYALSSPMQQLWRHGYLDGDRSVFDYGCGRGDDVRALADKDISANGWDPHFAPDAPKLNADIVNLGFVLNVIEDPGERAQALQGAWALTNKVLAVAVILGGRSVYERFRLYRDGVVTRTGTFQKYFTQSELREYVAATLDREPIAIAPGILFVFKDDQEEQSFLADRELSRRPSTALPRGIRVPGAPRARKPSRWDVNRELIEDFWDRCVDLGRPPQVDEFDRSAELREKLGLPKTVYRRCLADFGEDTIRERQAERMADRLVYLALNLFERRRSLKSLPETVRRDTKAFWGSYGTASAEAKNLLFSIGSPDVIYEACSDASERGLGSLASPRAFLFHSSVMHELPAPLRVYLGCAARIYGEFEQVDLVKIHIGSSKVSIMKYDDFEGRAIPLLVERTKIRLGAADYEVYRYGDEFPPTPLYFKGRSLPDGFPRRDDQLKFDSKLADATGLEIVDHGPGALELSKILEDLDLEVHGFRLRRRSRGHQPSLVAGGGGLSADIGSVDSPEIAREQEQAGEENRGNLSTDQPEERRMTILEAAIQILRDSKQPMPDAEIYESIVEQGLYTFGAKSPRSVLSGTLRNHIKKSPSPQVIEASPGSYTLPESPAT
jgi:DNA phosphorothioation-associated putative methyltransferase